MLVVYIHNVSEGTPVSSYEWVVLVNRQAIARGVVKRHRRSKGWRELLRRVATSPGFQETT